MILHSPWICSCSGDQSQKFMPNTFYSKFERDALRMVNRAFMLLKE